MTVQLSRSRRSSSLIFPRVLLRAFAQGGSWQFFFDLIFVSILCFTLFVALAFLTFGFSLIILPPLFPVVAFFYNGLTVSGHGMASPGMRAMDLEMRLTDGTRVPFLNAAVHAVLFYVSTMFLPVFLVSLFSENKRCLHDMIAGVIVTRRII